MKMNILLVDDEAVDLEWLRRRVLGSALDLHIAGTANNGFAALKILEQEPVDLILSDIRMPIMSGTDFARRAKEIHPNVKIVFISGHEDFGYAREAIEINAHGYLLKPVGDEELHGMLSSVFAKVEQERERNRSVSEALSLVGEELLLRWFHDVDPGQVESHIRSFLEPLLRGGTAAAIVEIDDLERAARNGSETDKRAITAQAAHLLKEFAEHWPLGRLLVSHNARFVVLATEPEDRFTLLLEGLLDEIRGKLPITVTIGIGQYARDMERLHESFRQAQAALSAKWLLGKNRLIKDSSESEPRGVSSSSLDEAVDRMLQGILEYDLVAIDDSLMELFGRSELALRKNDVYDLIIRITSKLHADLQKMNENLYELLQWESHQPMLLFQFETVQDVISWLRRRFFELSELLYSKKQKQKRKIIDEIIRYVEEKLEQKVTLKEVAAHFAFTPNYLGHLFHEETGLHFSDFMQEKRMDRVRALLGDPTLKVYEIAERVGYKNIIYFNRQFKQFTGMTPGEYRKKHRI
ncbi:response regulator [Cohnella candidum]|uniref:Response regulator n=1 Tax=Cohnella candidum TaxID=2674991 RepID=A0A3G3JSY4_9BACL|nr:response regulator [Cohnella candidum]AYQ71328.1 response regulator [Cohnella candidum]